MHRQSKGRAIEREFMTTIPFMCAATGCANRAVGASNYCDQHRPAPLNVDRRDGMRLTGDSAVIGTALVILCGLLLWCIYAMVTA